MSLNKFLSSFLINVFLLVLIVSLSACQHSGEIKYNMEQTFSALKLTPKILTTSETGGVDYSAIWMLDAGSVLSAPQIQKAGFISADLEETSDIKNDISKKLSISSDKLYHYNIYKGIPQLDGQYSLKQDLCACWFYLASSNSSNDVFVIIYKY